MISRRRRRRMMPHPDPSICREPSPELTSALKKELLAIISGDKLGVGSLAMAEQFSAHARALLSTLDPRLGMIDPDASDDDSSYPTFMTGPYPNPMVASSSEETYGAALGRELVAVAAKKTPADPVALVNAIAVAREKGLDDIAERLEKELLGVSASPAAPELAAAAEDSVESVDEKEAV